MLINQSNLDGIYTSLNGTFNAAFKGAATFYQKVAMVVPSNGRVNDYKFMLQFPMLQEWIGDRKFRSLTAANFQIVNKDYEASIEVDRNDIEDDQIGIYNPIVAELGRAAAQHPDLLIAKLFTDGFSTNCYDGQYFFDTDHVIAGANVSNSGGGASYPWFLLDTTKGIKPFLFQQRTQPTLTRQDRPDDENMFLRKKFRYGVDYRGAVGYGLWQLAYGSKTTLTTSLFQAAYNAMIQYKNDEGVALGITPNLLVVHPSYTFTAKEILEADFLLDTTVGGSKSNVNKGLVDLLVVPWLQ
jgi:phage major head subunit gpT-like protein